MYHTSDAFSSRLCICEPTHTHTHTDSRSGQHTHTRYDGSTGLFTLQAQYTCSSEYALGKHKCVQTLENWKEHQNKHGPGHTCYFPRSRPFYVPSHTHTRTNIPTHKCIHTHVGTPHTYTHIHTFKDTHTHLHTISQYLPKISHIVYFETQVFRIWFSL